MAQGNRQVARHSSCRLDRVKLPPNGCWCNNPRLLLPTDTRNFQATVGVEDEGWEGYFLQQNEYSHLEVQRKSQAFDQQANGGDGLSGWQWTMVDASGRVAV